MQKLAAIDALQRALTEKNAWATALEGDADRWEASAVQARATSLGYREAAHEIETVIAQLMAEAD